MDATQHVLTWSLREDGPRQPSRAVPGLAPMMLDKRDFKLDQSAETKAGSNRIRCPVCQWQPQRANRWYCLPMGAPENFSGGCGHAWNTFDTRGLCPGCRYQWRHTSCLRCSATSLHDEWYEKGPGVHPLTP